MGCSIGCEIMVHLVLKLHALKLITHANCMYEMERTDNTGRYV